LALIETWAGIALAYCTDWPATFWIVTLGCVGYVASAFVRRPARSGSTNLPTVTEK
jgi:zinc/manganese transport system permease protein